jgi:hypothetical protein
VTVLEFDTPHGQANANLHPAEEARAALVLGHGAGGGVTARDLVAATNAARGVGVSVALVEQPYRVAGRRSPAPAHQLDAAWTAVVDQLLEGELRGVPLIAGGRSSGARVACRTAGETWYKSVECSASPSRCSRRACARPRHRGRLLELEAVTVPAADRCWLPRRVQGCRPPVRPHDCSVVADHALKTDPRNRSPLRYETGFRASLLG